MSLWVILILIFAIILSAILTFYFTKKHFLSKHNLIIEQAQIKANAIEKEAQMNYKKAQIKLKEQELELQNKYEQDNARETKALEIKALELEKREILLQKDEQSLQKERDALAMQQSINARAQQEISSLKEKYKAKQNELIDELANYTSLSKNEAKAMLLRNLEDSLKNERANLIRRSDQENKEMIKKHANYILAMATTRYAGEYTAEKLINVVHLADDEMKGRIIGKDGRNIKVLELISGVDILIDDTPNTIILSSFNLYRRAIALNAINILIEDGRIHPARIEEVYKKCEAEMEQNIINDGENIVLDLKLGYMHPELKKLIGKMKYRASFGQNALAHSIEVAHLSGLIAAELDGDEILAKRAGLLHDIGKSLTHEICGDHVSIGCELAQRYKEHPTVINAILAHHGNEEANSIEAAAVCTADIISSARPGARRDVLENYLNRMQDLEKIALNFLGVRQAYAINAGREIRVIVKPDEVDDKEAIIMAKEIANAIESTLQYPGEVKVNVIREIRAIQYAK